jgi:hypothetical protein
MTLNKLGLVQFETYFTYKAEVVFGDSVKTPLQYDGNYHPCEAMFGSFTIWNDVIDAAPECNRHHDVLRYVNTDFAGNFVKKWMYKTSLQVTTKMQLSGTPTPKDNHTVNPDDWREVPGGSMSLAHNEVPTKINWHYLRWLFDTEKRRNVELQVNEHLMDLREIPVPQYPPNYYKSINRILNFCVDVRTHMNVRNFLFLDSVLVSVDW